jgi:elongation factor Ts
VGNGGGEKRSGRATNEGRVFVLETGKAISLVEIVCETDFVAKNADFIAAGDKIAAKAFEMKADGPNETLEAMVKDIAVVIKENIALKRVRISPPPPESTSTVIPTARGKSWSS